MPPDPAPRFRGRGRPVAALVLLLLTALGLIGHHTLPAGATPAPHTAMSPSVSAPRAAVAPGPHAAPPAPVSPSGSVHHGSARSGPPPAPARHAGPVAARPAQACAEHRVCSSTVPTRGALLDAPPPDGLAPSAFADPAPRPVTAPGIPWPGAPPPDLDALSISRT
ncbi:hypothetical protein ACFCX4_25785 [Kitasatospora sp. NPDC056327]|uniref:hypothetical protein n=1 Tax=Kitasatospora sp. NPDC056327 TaxID=3345785 RepID=UPI0035DB60BB